MTAPMAEDSQAESKLGSCDSSSWVPPKMAALRSWAGGRGRAEWQQHQLEATGRQTEPSFPSVEGRSASLRHTLQLTPCHLMMPACTVPHPLSAPLTRPSTCRSRWWSLGWCKWSLPQTCRGASSQVHFARSVSWHPLFMFGHALERQAGGATRVEQARPILNEPHVNLPSISAALSRGSDSLQGLGRGDVIAAGGGRGIAGR